MPPFVTVMGFVTWSPGAIALNVTNALVGEVLMVTVPVVKVLAGTDAVLVNSVKTLTLMSAAKAPRSITVATSFLAIDPSLALTM